MMSANKQKILLKNSGSLYYHADDSSILNPADWKVFGPKWGTYYSDFLWLKTELKHVGI